MRSVLGYMITGLKSDMYGFATEQWKAQVQSFGPGTFRT